MQEVVLQAVVLAGTRGGETHHLSLQGHTPSAPAQMHHPTMQLGGMVGHNLNPHISREVSGQ
jgi:hypothetical protein